VPLVGEIEAAGGRAHALALDARDEDNVQAAFEFIERELGPLAVVVFNVGANVNFPIRETTSRVFRKVWEMACFGGFLTGRAAAQVMVARGRGSIFFTGATASLRGGRGYAAFAAAKAGLRMVAQSMARELWPENIHVAHLVIDAGVDTAWVRERIRAGGGDPDALPAQTLMDPASVGAAYWQLHHQPRDAWTFELEIRPFREVW
jgi:NAD(P)-dependent dehydrogenase (short-subunit alcohol dehydrogenase family)